MPKTKGQKYYFDTSIFLEMLKMEPKDFQAKISRIAPGKKFATHYSLIEINRQCMALMVKLYQRVEELQDVPSAWGEVSNWFGRGPKYGAIIYQNMMRMHTQINHQDYIFYLNQLEACIVDIHDRILSLVNDFIGTFGGHELAKITIESRRNFGDLTDITKRSGKVNLESFWKSNANQLRILVAKLAETEESRKLKKNELAVKSFAEAVLAAPDAKTTSPHKGDLVIALECPKTQQMVAHDHLFDILIPYLEKSGGYVSL